MPNKPLNTLVGLDLSEMDAHLISYLRALNETLKIGKVTFVHNIKLGQLPKDYLTTERLHKIQNKITKKVKERVDQPNAPYECEVKVTMDKFSETSFENISKEDSFDLLVLGNKQHLKGNGSLPKKLVQLFPSSILLVPETFSSPINRILKAITFSKYTKSIMEWGQCFENNTQEHKIAQFPVYISKLFYYPLMSTEEADRLTKKDFKDKEKKWTKDFGDYGKLHVVSAEEKGVSTTLKQCAKEKDADLLIMGVQGESKIRNLFIGSVANEMLLSHTETALLFVKPDKSK